MSEQAIEGLSVQATKLIRAYERLKKENGRLKKQLAVTEMEKTQLRDKHQLACDKVDKLIQQLTTLEGQQ